MIVQIKILEFITVVPLMLYEKINPNPIKVGNVCYAFKEFIFNFISVSTNQSRRSQRGDRPQYFGRSINPFATKGQNMPTTSLLPPRIFRPSYDPADAFQKNPSFCEHIQE